DVRSPDRFDTRAVMIPFESVNAEASSSIVTFWPRASPRADRRVASATAKWIAAASLTQRAEPGERVMGAFLVLDDFGCLTDCLCRAATRRSRPRRRRRTLALKGCTRSPGGRPGLARGASPWIGSREDRYHYCSYDRRRNPGRRPGLRRRSR